MKRLIVVACLIVSACSGDSPSGPSGGGNQPTFTLSGLVTEAAPTTDVIIANATVRIIDGQYGGRITTSDAAGAYSFTGLQAGNFNVEASAANYETRAFGVPLVGSQTLHLTLRPTFRVGTSSVNESISGGDPICLGTTPCKQFSVVLHYDGTIDSTLTWNDQDTWLWLRLSRLDGTEIAESSSSRINGLRQRVTANVQGGQKYILTVRYLLGARVTPFTLSATRPSMRPTTTVPLLGPSREEIARAEEGDCAMKLLALATALVRTDAEPSWANDRSEFTSRGLKTRKASWIDSR